MWNFFRSLSAELGRGRNKVTCVILNPGVVLTDLSRPYHKSVPKDHLLTSGKKYFEKNQQHEIYLFYMIIFFFIF